MKIRCVKLRMNPTNIVQCMYDLDGRLSIHDSHKQRCSFHGAIQVEHFSHRKSVVNMTLHFDCLVRDFPSYIEKIKMICKDNKDAIMYKDTNESALSQLAQIKYMDFPEEEIIIELAKDEELPF